MKLSITFNFLLELQHIFIRWNEIKCIPCFICCRKKADKPQLLPQRRLRKALSKNGKLFFCPGKIIFIKEFKCLLDLHLTEYCKRILNIHKPF